jgi:hypothetical protein
MIYPYITTIFKPFLHWLFIKLLELHFNFVHTCMIAHNHQKIKWLCASSSIVLTYFKFSKFLLIA